MSELPPTPGDTLGSAGEAAGASPDGAPGVEETEAKDVLDLLLHTEPDLSPADIERKMGVGPAPSNAIVGVRKVLHGATGRGGGSGTPALVNFGAAAYHAVGFDTGDEPEPEVEETSDQEVADAFSAAAKEGEL